MLDRLFRRPLYAAAIAAFVAAGCSEQSDRLNAPPQGASDRVHPLQDNFTYMVDNAMLADRSIADIHFEPNTVELSGLGVRRLNRMAELLSEIGGTIRYETSLKDGMLVQGRLDTIRDFLASAGYEATTMNVEPGLPYSHPTKGTDAIEIMIRGTNPQEAGSGGGSMTPPTAP